MLPLTWRLLLVSALSITAFLPGVHNDFLLDDRIIILDKIDSATPANLVDSFRQTYWKDYANTGIFRPLTTFWLTLQMVAFGPDSASFHIVGILIHTACTVLLFLILARLFSQFVALSAAILFALHPLHAEVLLTGIGQGDSLAALFVLGSIYAYMRDRLALSSVLFFCGLLTKESAVILPALALLIRVLYIKPELGYRIRREWIYSIPFCFYLAYRAMVIGGLNLPSNIAFVSLYSWKTRFNVILAGLTESIRFSLFPWKQTLDHRFDTPRISGIQWNDLVILSLTLLAVCLLCRWLGPRKVLFPVLWFTILWFPVSNIVPITTVFGERLCYLSVSAFAILLAMILERLPNRPAAVTALSALVLICGTLDFRLTHRWQDEIALWESTIADYPSNPFAHNSLGMLLLDRNRGADINGPEFLQAGQQIDTALRLAPEMPVVHFAKGLYLSLRGECAASKPFLDRARHSLPVNPKELRTPCDGPRSDVASAF